METSLKADFAQIFSRCPKNLSCLKFGGAAAPLGPLTDNNVCWTIDCFTTSFSPGEDIRRSFSGIKGKKSGAVLPLSPKQKGRTIAR